MKFFIKNWKKILPLMGLFLLAYLLWHFDIKEIIRAFSEVNWWYFLLLPFVFLLIFLVQTRKWQLVLNAQNINGINFFQLFKIQLVGVYYGSLTPGHAGAFVKAAYLKDSVGKPIEECSSGIFIDKILDLIVLFIFSGVGALVLISQFPFLLPRAILALIIICFIIFIFYNKRRTRFLLKRLFYIFIPQKFKSRFRDSFYLFYKERPPLRALIAPFLLTLLCWLLIFTQIFVIAKSLSININYFIFVFITALATMVGLLPITISGLGTREVAFVILFKNFGIAPQKLIAMSLLSAAAGFVLLFLIAIIFIKDFFKKI